MKTNATWESKSCVTSQTHTIPSLPTCATVQMLGNTRHEFHARSQPGLAVGLWPASAPCSLLRKVVEALANHGVLCQRRLAQVDASYGAAARGRALPRRLDDTFQLLIQRRQRGLRRKMCLFSRQGKAGRRPGVGVHWNAKLSGQ